MSYKVKLEIFEGPLDLLFYLIKKEEIDIYNIPIAKITEQYLEYLELMKLLDLNIAGEFLVMAATLMHIKSKMLLPPVEGEEEMPEEEDPMEELVRRLLEYKKFKEAAAQLCQKGLRQKDFFGRGAPPLESDANGEEYFEASLFDLISAFTKVIKDVPEQLFHEVIKDEFTVDEKIHDIFHLLVANPVLSLNRLFSEAKSKLEIITTFLAVLELMRLKEITVKQSRTFGEIIIERNKELMKAVD